MNETIIIISNKNTNKSKIKLTCCDSYVKYVSQFALCG